MLSQPIRWLPITQWIRTYTRDDFVNDLIAGVIVAIMLVPQSMAYAMLAGLPPEVGLYASIAPLVVYGLLGTSRALAVGPVAIMSLLVASGLTPLAEPGSPEYVQLALVLALLAGLLQIVMGLARLGFLVNFLSHPVLSGFTSAAAIVIGFSQVKHLLGVSVPRLPHFYEQVAATLRTLPETNPTTLAIGLASIAILFTFKTWGATFFRRLGFSEQVALMLSKTGPLVVVALSTLLVWGLRLHERAGVAIVGTIPQGLPPFGLPPLDLTLWQTLLPTALTLVFVGYMESISVAKALASKRREKVDANQELLALGAADIAAALTGAYPVAGGFGRSVVNFMAGARSGIASIITAALILLTVLALTPLFYFLPRAVLAAIVIVAVSTLFDVHTLKHTWAYNKADAVALIATFLAVLIVGVETGILVGVAVTIALYLWRTSRPHVAIVGRLPGTQIYRNIARHKVETCPHVLAVRVDESLYFANTQFLEDLVLSLVADNPDIRAFVLIGTAINFIDASALETLEDLAHRLRDAGVEMHFAAIKGPVMDRLQAVGFVDAIGRDHFHLHTHDAMRALGCVADEDEDEQPLQPVEAAA
ncbi:sulfate permease, SulP family [Ardenticatena maritima]|uniref:Sulfate permease, SulP family n=1 Tax=Ardenticatena maritima TaxID=872965 RepID=A0A0M8KAX1_9CHLR|nr:solute carrier family 26 protein [Ardenticatena maritima]KPL89377.1 sulfate:proton symporter [Ardenticatena maritima]GAP63876.1 sulfate permease, SulP family [Ardenticatena maritima]